MSNRAQEWARAQKVGNPGAKFILWVLGDFADAQGGSCFPKVKTLAADTEQSERTVRRHLDHLEEIGLIQRYRSRRKDGTYGHYNYRLNMSKNLLVEPEDNLTSGQNDQRSKCPSPAVKMTAQEPSYYPPIDKKEKKTLTREEFLREIDRGYQSQGFNAFDWLTETEIKGEADACLDFYGSKGEWPAGDPVVVLRHWIRGGIKNGSVRNKPKESKACQGEQEALQPWQEKAKAALGDKVFVSWIKPLTLQGVDTVIAPSKFIADRVSSNFYRELSEAIGCEIQIIHQQQKEKELCLA